MTTLPQDSAARKEIPLYRGLLRYFPAALAAAARISKVGNEKHNPGEEMHHARGKSMDHGDCIIRHLIDLPEDFGAGVGRDEDGELQVGYLVWRALAFAQEWLELEGLAPPAPGARFPEPKPERLDRMLEQRPIVPSCTCGADRLDRPHLLTCPLFVPPTL